MFDFSPLLVLSVSAFGAALGVSVAVFFLPPAAAVPVGLVVGGALGGAVAWWMLGQ